MTTVQIVLSDVDYAQSLRTLLVNDGYHAVIRHRAEFSLEGVIVLDTDWLVGNWLDHFEFGKHSDRIVVVASRAESLKLTDLWAASIRHIVYREDPISTAHLAIIAAELRLHE